MNYKIVVGVLLLLIYIFPAFAVEVTNINNPNTINDANPQIKANAEILAKITVLEQKLNNYATKSDVQGLLEAHLGVVNKIFDNFFTNFLVYFVLIGLGLLGLFFGILFYFKSKGRL